MPWKAGLSASTAVVIGVVSGVIGLGAPVAHADDLPSSAAVTMANTFWSATEGQFPQVHVVDDEDGDDDVTVTAADDRHVMLSAGGAAIEVLAPDGQVFREGTSMSNGRPGDPVVRVHLGPSVYTMRLSLDVRDLAVRDDGTLSRFDIVFGDPSLSDRVVFGQIRMGQEEHALRASATALRWPEAPLRTRPVWADVAVRNTADAPVALGPAALQGASASSWSLADDRCSGTVLPSGGSCTVRTVFRPTAAGPMTATVVIPAPDTPVTIALMGTGRPGITRLTSSGDEAVHKNRKWTDNETGGRVLVQSGRLTKPDQLGFSSSLPYEYGPSQQGFLLQAPLAASHLEAGKHRSGSIFQDDHYGIEASAGGYGCPVGSGTVSISNLGLAADGSVDHAHVLGTFQCGDGTARVELLWRNRSDVTAPRGPRSLTLDTGAVRSVTWGDSLSKDAAATIVRAVAGNGDGATPLSGYPVGAGRAGQATLPTDLPIGSRYTVMAWSVDASGNVSGALRRSFTT